MRHLPLACSKPSLEEDLPGTHVYHRRTCPCHRTRSAFLCRMSCPFSTCRAHQPTAVRTLGTPPKDASHARNNRTGVITALGMLKNNWFRLGTESTIKASHIVSCADRQLSDRIAFKQALLYRRRSATLSIECSTESIIESQVKVLQTIGVVPSWR